MQQMCVGDKWEVYIPAEMGYEQREQKPNLFGLCRVVTEEDEVKYAANAMFLKAEAKKSSMPTI